MKKNNKFKISDILRGKFLVDDAAPKNWKFLFFILFLAFIMVFSSHLLNKKVSELNKLKEENEEIKTQYAEIHSKLMKLRLESELVRQVKIDSLKSLEKNPFKIIVNKYDN